MVCQVLVDYYGKTKCLIFDVEKVLGQDVLSRFEHVEGIPSKIVYLVHNASIVSKNSFVPLSPAVIHLCVSGLKGGKGGFGAMLRSMGKTAGSRTTRNFGACRDLHGRRLRHVNQEIAIQKWNEDKANRDQMKKDNVDVREIEDDKTSSGIPGWHLNVPSWAEGVKQSHLKNKRKTIMCKEWVEAREKSTAPERAPLWWGCPRGRSCDFAHGDKELRGAGLTEYKQKQKDEGMRKKIEAEEKYLKTADIDEEVSNAVAIGLKKQKDQMKRKFRKAFAADAQILPVQPASSSICIKKDASCWITPLFGSVNVDESDVTGISAFGTASVYGCYLNTGKWYYEAEVLSDGLIQIGWADQDFEGNSDSGDGVGDHSHSWAFDGYRQRKWNAEDVEYGEKWKKGDIIGCFLDLESATISFALNGKHLGTAFQVRLENPPPRTRAIGFYPAFSLNEGESLRINIGQQQFAYPESIDKMNYAPVYSILQAVSGKEASNLKSDCITNTLGNEKQVTKINNQSNISSNDKKIEEEKVNLEAESSPDKIDLSQYSSVEDLVKLGLEGLKNACVEKGLKCGGSLRERAERLYSTKGLSWEEINPKLKARKCS